MESYSLFQLNEYIRRVIALNFREPLWIEAEIAQIKNSRGNFYLELIEKDENSDDVIAQMSAAIWYRSYLFIKKKVGDLVDDLLQDGTQVKLKCKVDFHERYGMKLIIEDIDPNFTFGKLELSRQKVINKLENEGLVELNKSLLIPSTIQRIAVISSEGAAGYQDFVQQLVNNEYGYTYKLDLYNCAVQGAKVEGDTCEAIADIFNNKEQYDIAIIIRGGGSKLDLSGYDSYEIAKAIALSDIPFVIGIGHDIDSTVTDMVSCLSLKTPTAVADYIIDRNLTFESRLEHSLTMVTESVQGILKTEEIQINTFSERLNFSVSQVIQNETYDLEKNTEKLEVLVDRLIEGAQHDLDKMELIINSVDPEEIMSKGYAYLLKNNKLISSKKDVSKDDLVSIHLKDGSVTGKIV